MLLSCYLYNLAIPAFNSPYIAGTGQIIRNWSGALLLAISAVLLGHSFVFAVGTVAASAATPAWAS